MNIAIAAALLIMLIVHIGKENHAAPPAPKKTERDELDWIDELEVLDAITDDFV
ncbi:MAG: hypothetical protein IJP64_00635 [Oscillospiraceae bacterium]|nr:hypothetical protein [Oscillospiraceae bacterium]